MSGERLGRGASDFWRTEAQRYRLVGEKCPECGELMFPPNDVCRGCGAGGAGWQSEPEKDNNQEVVVFEASDSSEDS